MNLALKIVGLLPVSWIKAVSRAQWRHRWLKRGFNWCAGRFKNQDGEISNGIGKGLRFNPGGSNAGYLLGTSEPGVQAVLAALIKPQMTVYDVGANVGFLSLIASRLVGPNGCVVCFEPLPSNASQIEHNARLNGFMRISVRSEALGAMDGTANFLVSADPTLGKLAMLGSSVPKQAGEITVTVRQLGSLIEEANLPLPHLIKIDVEGAETDVLAGAANCLRKARPLLMIELHGTNAAVSAALKSMDYHAVVLGSRKAIVDSPWNAYVIAAPKEHMGFVQAVDDLCSLPTER